MGRYCLQTSHSNTVKKSLKKWGQIPVDDKVIKGVINIKNVRQYSMYWEADVELQGLSWLYYGGVKDFYSSDIQKKKNVSKIKLNRILRRQVFNHVNSRLKYFSADIRGEYNIKKITWI